MLTVFESNQPGAITHVWFTIAARSDNHLKELVLRAYWDGNSKPSVETPIGDFFGLTLGQYVNYDSAFLCCSPGKSLNCYFVMPYKKSARITVTNEGRRGSAAFTPTSTIRTGIFRRTRCIFMLSTGKPLRVRRRPPRTRRRTWMAATTMSSARQRGAAT